MTINIMVFVVLAMIVLNLQALTPIMIILRAVAANAVLGEK